DPPAYRLRRPADQATILIQQGVPPDIATFIRSISEVPLGAPAPQFGWSPGETVVIADRPVAPIARPCIPPAVDRGGFLNEQDANRLRNVERLPDCGPRWRDSQRISPGDYVKDPDNYAGRDVRLVGIACNVRYNRGRGVTTMTI